MINKLLIVGCGLIGSSILKKVCKKRIAKKIFVFEKSKKNQRILKRFKLKFELIKKIDKKVSECDFVVICAPLSEYEKIFSLCNKYLKRNAVVTDVGSAKKSTITKINKIKTNKVSANFLLLDFDYCKYSAIRIKKSLEKKGILLRSLEAYKLKNKLRLTIGNTRENVLLLKILEKIFKK